MIAPAFWTIMVLVILAFIAGMIYVFKKNKIEDAPLKVDEQSLNSFDATLNTITKRKEQQQTEKPNNQQTINAENISDKKDKDKIKFKSDDYIKEIQEKNHMRKTAMDHYFENSWHLNENSPDK